MLLAHVPAAWKQQSSLTASQWSIEIQQGDPVDWMTNTEKEVQGGGDPELIGCFNRVPGKLRTN